MYKIGVNLYGMGADLTNDFPAAIEALHKIGFDGAEAPFLNKGKQGKWPGNLLSKERMDTLFYLAGQYGMEMPSAHVTGGFGAFLRPAKSIASELAYLNETYGIRNFVFSGPFSDAKGAKKWGLTLKAVSELAKPLNCNVIYHNHEAEFTKITDGSAQRYPMDIFFEYAGPDVLLQLDIGWARFVGDEVELARRYADRIIMIHCKDLYADAVGGKYERTKLPGELFAPIGEGIVRTGEVIRMAEEMPDFNGWLIIDQDRCGKGDSMLRNLESGHGNLRALCK